jgi:hypothetical protein
MDKMAQQDAVTSQNGTLEFPTLHPLLDATPSQNYY